jgi:hypothetical protein
MDALMHAVDGNFVNNLKDKNVDPHDVPLTMGAAYFANEKEFAEYQNILGDIKPEVRSLPYHRTSLTNLTLAINM